MTIQWDKIKDGIELFQREKVSIFVVPEVGRIYVTDRDERQARSLGGNPVCRLSVALAGVGIQKPLFLIGEMGLRGESLSE